MEQMSPDVVATLVDHHQRFRAFLERRVGSRAEAEELLHAALVKSVERGGELRDGESAVAWFYRLLRNAVVDFYRQTRRGGPSIGTRERCRSVPSRTPACTTPSASVPWHSRCRR